MEGTAAKTELEIGLFEQRLAAAAELLESKLDAVLPKGGRLADAMRYAVLGAGKRFRPFLVFESSKLFDVSESAAMNVAAAIECVHCYSLVHDDLPSMDDDDMRRGKPSVHKQFDEATAILAGDALQSLAFELLANEGPELVRGLAHAAGFAGMAGGQQLDMAAEHAKLHLEEAQNIQRLKTGALIAFSVDAGAILGGAKPNDRHALQNYSKNLGVAYDLADQLADAEEDAAAGKSTIVSVLGMNEARSLLARTVDEAIATLVPFGDRAHLLQEAAQFMLRPFT